MNNNQDVHYYVVNDKHHTYIAIGPSKREQHKTWYAKLSYCAADNHHLTILYLYEQTI